MSPISLSRGPNVSRDLALGRTRLVSGLRAGTRGRRPLLDSSMTSSTTMFISMTSTRRTSLIRSTTQKTMGHTRLVHARTGECYNTAGQPRAFVFSGDGKRRPTVRTRVIVDGAGATSGTVTRQVRLFCLSDSPPLLFLFVGSLHHIYPRGGVNILCPTTTTTTAQKRKKETSVYSTVWAKSKSSGFFLRVYIR